MGISACDIAIDGYQRVEQCEQGPAEGLRCGRGDTAQDTRMETDLDEKDGVNAICVEASSALT